MSRQHLKAVHVGGSFMNVRVLDPGNFVHRSLEIILMPLEKSFVDDMLKGKKRTRMPHLFEMNLA